MAELTPEELLRYSRQTILPEFGLAGQEKLKAAKVALIGAGGLGSPAALYLAAAGVGTMGVVDFDAVDLTNLHRQVLHGTGDVGRSKLDSAEARVYEINPHVRVVRHEVRLTSGNALDILADYDLVVDGTDNFPTRYLVNDACVLLGKPNMYGSVFGFEGQATVFCAPGGPCYRCLYPQPPPPGLVPSCAEGGVLGILPGVIGLIQATEAVKWIVGIGEPLVGRLLLYDALKMQFRELRIRRDPACPMCGEHRTIKRLIDYEEFCGLRGVGSAGEEVDPAGLRAMISSGSSLVLLDVREPFEVAAGSIPGAVPIPLGQVPSRVGELDPDTTTVVICRSGSRSAKACGILRDAGFKNVLNLKGGMIEWARTR